MKSNLSIKLIIAICLSFVLALTFTACKDKEIYAESSDFESYPEYWNDFNEDHGDLYVSGSDTSSEDNDDWTANEDDDNTSSDVDTDNDSITNDKDTDIDGDGVDNKDDNDVDGDGVENDKDPDIDGDGAENEDDDTPEGPTEEDKSDKNEGPFVPLG